jgi:hypothetical protein
MNVARLQLARMGGTAGSPHDPPSPTALAPQRSIRAAPAMSVAAAKILRGAWDVAR